MKLSEQIRNLAKEARPNWTEEETRERSFFPEWADEVARLEEKNAVLIAQVNGLIDEMDHWHNKGYLSVDPIGSIYYGRRKE